MTILGAFRDWLPARDAAAKPASDGDTDQAASLPFEGYDGVDTSQLTQELSDRSQIELEAVETYERAHKGREAVLDKLRYLRRPEPLPGYDALSADEILARLEDADLATVKRVRGYKRKFAKRPGLLEEVVRTQKELRAALPEGEARSYEPLSAAEDSGRG